MADRSEVLVDHRSVESARREGGTEVWIELRTTSEGAGRAFTAVLEEMETAGAERGGPVGSLGVRSVDGYVSVVADVAGRPALDAWLEDLIVRLRDRGVSGSIRGAPRVQDPVWLPYRLPVPTAFLAWSIDQAAVASIPGGMHYWGVTPEATARIFTHAAGWTRAGGPDILLRQGTFMCRSTDGSSIEPVLLDATTRAPNAGAAAFDDDLRRGRAMTIGKGGRMTLQHLHGEPSWRTQVDEVREGITALSDDLDVAVVRRGRPWLNGWGDIDVRQPLPDRRVDLLFRNRHLLVDHVPDAHGLQVLRDEHLARATDLGRWQVTDLGHGRHLVEAADLEPWYGSGLPDPTVVEQARRDFGAMILTREAIAANPPP
ncbi:MAG TPA: hypothetical protein VF228_09315 [Iamia sp.]